LILEMLTWAVAAPPAAPRVSASNTKTTRTLTGSRVSPLARKVRDLESIDRELRLLARAWRLSRQMNEYRPSTAHIDELLDERCAATARRTIGYSIHSMTPDPGSPDR
jgi:predicted RNase H-like nuclease